MMPPRFQHSCVPHGYGGGRPVAGFASVAEEVKQSLDCRSAQIGVPASLEFSEGSIDQNSSGFSVSGQTRSQRGRSGRSRTSHSEAGSGRSSGPCLPGLLRTSVCRSKSLGRMASGAGSFSAKSFSEEDQVYHGDSHLSEAGPQATRLGHLHRSFRRLLPHPDAPNRPEVAPLCLGQQDFSIQSSAFRPFTGSLDLHDGGSPVLHTDQRSRYSSTDVPRRLANSESGTISVPHAHTDRVAGGSGARLHDQLQEVRVDTFPELYVSGNGIQHCGMDSSAHSEEDKQDPGSHKCHGGSVYGFGQVSDVHPRPDGIAGSSDSFGQALQAPVSGGAELQVGPSVSGLGDSSPTSGLVYRNDQTVAGHSLALAGSSHSPFPAFEALVHRCLSRGVGGSPGKSHNLWSLEPGASQMAHKSAGVRSSLSSTDGVPTLCQGGTCSGSLRQHHSGVLSEQTRGVSLSAPVAQGMRDLDVESQSWCSFVSKVPSGKAECLGRLSESVFQDSTHGVDDHSSSASSPLGPSGEAVHRLIRHTVLTPSADFRVPISRSRSVGSQCSGNILERADRLRFSSHSPPREGPAKGRHGKTISDSRGTILAGTALVPGPSATVKRPTSSSRSQKRRLGTASIGHSPRESAVACPARLDSVRESLKRSGASDATIDLIQASHRGSTSSVYTSHWLAWLKWCKANGVKPTSPRSIQVANHLSWLASQGAAPASLKVRRSAISVTLKQLGHSISREGFITSVLKGASLRFDKTKSAIPAWDLPLVLEYLRTQDFEPLCSASLANLTRKAVFLVMLASGRRGSEIHALSGSPRDVSFEKDGSVILRFCAKFLAKNQKPDKPSPLIQIKPLSSILAPSDPDIANCPVRVLRAYLSRSNPIRSSSQKLLFLSVNTKREKDIIKSTLARWVSTLVRQAYIWWQRKGGGQSVLPLRSARTHELRAWASSSAVLRSRRLQEVMDSAYWASEDVFMNFYLRDIASSRMDGTFGLPAMVAAGQMLSRC